MTSMNPKKRSNHNHAIKKASMDYTVFFGISEFDIDALSGLTALPSGPEEHTRCEEAKKEIPEELVGCFSEEQANYYARNLYLFLHKAEGIFDTAHLHDDIWVEARLDDQKVSSKGQLLGNEKGEVEFNTSFTLVFKRLPCAIRLEIVSSGGRFGKSATLDVRVESFICDEVQEFVIQISRHARLHVGIAFDESRMQHFCSVLKEDKERLSQQGQGFRRRRSSLKPNASLSSSEGTALHPTLTRTTGIKLIRTATSPEATVVAVDQDVWRIGKRFEILPGRLSFGSHRSDSETLVESFHRSDDLHFMTSSLHERYKPFHADFGPLSLSLVYHFCELMDKKLSCKKLFDKHLVYTTGDDVEHRTNAAFLICAFLILGKGVTPEAAWEPFSRIRPSPFRPFRDASTSPAMFTLSVLDVVRGLARAKSEGWFDRSTFDLKGFEAAEQPHSCEVRQVCPKLVVFGEPDGFDSKATGQQAENLHKGWGVQMAGALRRRGVSAIVRLNSESKYGPDVFTSHGFRHHTIPVDAGGIPTEEAVESFLDTLGTESDAVGLHCKAGRGRAGTLAALWIIRHHGWSPKEAISWIRLVAPGSIVGIRQTYLRDCAERGFQGNSLRNRSIRSSQMDRRHAVAPKAVSSGSAPAESASEGDSEAKVRRGSLIMEGQTPMFWKKECPESDGGGVAGNRERALGKGIGLLGQEAHRGRSGRSSLPDLLSEGKSAESPAWLAAVAESQTRRFDAVATFTGASAASTSSPRMALPTVGSTKSLRRVRRVSLDSV